MQTVIGDLGDPRIVEHAVAGVGIVYHVGAAMRGGPRDFEAGTIWGTRNVLDACRKHATARLVYVSSMSVFDHAARRKGEVLTEDYRFEPHPQLRGAYTQTKLKAYAEQRRKTVSKRTHVVPRRTVWSIKEARDRLEALLGDGAAQWVHLDAFLQQYGAVPDIARTALASSFGASLEMARDGLIELSQAEPFAPIYMRRREAGADWQRSTVITLLQRLERKAYVVSDRSRRAFVYRAVVSRDELVHQRMVELADELCDGRHAPLLLAFAERQTFTPDELRSLRALIDVLARKQGKPQRPH